MPIPLFILAGGKGTRAQSVFSGPKILMPIAGKTILERQIEFAHSFKISDILLVLAHKAGEVANFVRKKGLPVACVFTDTGASNGGNLKESLKFAAGNSEVLVINGDTLTDIPLDKFERYHDLFSGRSKQTATLACIHWPNTAEYGTVEIGRYKIKNFAEKTGKKREGWINAGCYIFPTEVFEEMPENFSIERDLLPTMAGKSKLICYRHFGFMFDCGTPERIAAAEEFFRKHKK